MARLIVIFLSLLLKVHAGIPCNNLKINLLEYLIRDIINETFPYQILLIPYDDANRVVLESEYIKKFIVRNFPTTTLHLHQMKKLDSIMQYPIFGSPRYSTLFVVLYTSDFNNETAIVSKITTAMDTYVEKFPRSIRPRWLIVLMNSETENATIQNLLREAWKKQFLDFTILEMAPGHMLLHLYNPFFDVYKTRLYEKNVNVFPDKLHNMNGYEVSTVFVLEPPNLYLRRNSTGHVLSINGSYYWLLLIASRVLNFSLVVKPTLVDTYSDIYNQTSVINAVLTGELDITGNQVYMWIDQQLERSMFLIPDAHCALVPNSHAPGIGVSSKFCYSIVLTCLYVGFLVFVSRLLRFSRKIWTWLNVFQVIVGCPVPRLPRRWKERLMIGSIIFLSVSYTSVYYAKMTGRKLRSNEQLFYNIRDLDKSGLVPLVFHPFYELIFHSQDKHVQSLKKKARFWRKSAECADEMMRNASVFCILSEFMDRAMVDKFSYKLKLLQPCFWITWKGFAYTRGSPYPEKFDKVFVGISESGLDQRWLEACRVRGEEADTETSKIDTVRKRIWFMLLAGYSLSTMIFLVELLTAYVNFGL